MANSLEILNEVYSEYDKVIQRVELKLLALHFSNTTTINPEVLRHDIKQAKHLLILHAKISGKKNVEIASIVGVSSARIFQITHHADRWVTVSKRQRGFKGAESLLRSHRNTKDLTPVTDDKLRLDLQRHQSYLDAFEYLINTRKQP